MTVAKTERGFELIEHASYTNAGEAQRLVQQSSAINFDAPDGVDKPGTSYLWIGHYHHLSRAEVRDLITHLQAWVGTGSLRIVSDQPTPPTRQLAGLPVEPMPTIADLLAEEEDDV
jgi:hypothetical protein